MSTAPSGHPAPGDSFEITCAEEGSRPRLDVFLARQLPLLSRSRIQKLIEGSEVTVDGQVQPPRHRLASGSVVRLTIPEPEAGAPQPQDIPVDVVYEDADLLVINKHAGIAVHPAPGNWDSTLVNALLGRNPQLSTIGGVFRPGLVHRLDKDTTGLMVVARNDTAHNRLAKALAARHIKRTYQAIVVRALRDREGVVDAPIGHHPNQRVQRAVVPDGKPSRTHYRVLEAYHGFTLVECRLETGRTHQIRVHMAHLGNPVLGDELYGGSARLAVQSIPSHDTALRAGLLKNATRQMLHAATLEFHHPASGEVMSFDAPPPGDFQSVLRLLRDAGAKG